ncbi:hypothetical protein [Frankia sp. R82]|uniref:hypothetical protein n=1 Tax=Frankia sp. R82 TaxID=2950553 RepID=UPI0020444F0D|nr:hypothetical protein [Frankia sp. R82]MCM3886388.1 hypothetical protein [Frankia sp. R82]
MGRGYTGLLDSVSSTGLQPALADVPSKRPVPSERPIPSERPVRPAGSASQAGRVPPGALAATSATSSGDRSAAWTGSAAARRMALLVLEAAVVVIVLLIGVSLGRTLALPGDAGPLARLADWGRANHLSFVVNRVDRS